MTKTVRTNVVPPQLLVLCVTLLLLRGCLIIYRTYFPEVSPALTIVWGDPSVLEKKRTDLLSKPRLYFVCDYSEPLPSFLSKLMGESVFNNREIVKYMNDNFQLVKVVHTKKDTEIVSKLIKQLHVYVYPSVVVCLVNGAIVDYCQWATDQGFMGFMRDTVLKKRFVKIAEQAMLHCDFKLACTAYENVDASQRSLGSYSLIYHYIALSHEHRQAEAKELLNKQLVFDRNQTSIRSDADVDPKYRFLLGELSESELFQAEKKRNDTDTIFTHYLLGEVLLLHGQASLAKQEFHRATLKNESWSQAYLFARAELIALGEKVPDLADDDDDNETGNVESIRQQ
jgi:hypothetical protein